ncbi:MAG: sugar ABC transporter permease [Firmicutes bacterium HGW-Firmicutes-20]|jgi:raffinose/stachyose/melibiose transport system permease protein|nr:MAG: sugar ABC transporter permease [Firmicutes bacterium HGW-Firmicutes-20]PKM86376.1 MAG: sugar ABC transporter permease [Firmicutes bacterium HGW-Firmicutes-10]
MSTSPIKKKRSFRRLFLELFGIGLLLLFFFPFLIVIINSAKSATEIISTPLSFPTDWSNLLRNITEILGRNNIDYFSSFFNSIFITSVSLITIGVFSAMAAWVLVRTKTKYSMFIFLFFLAGMVIPFQVVMLPLVRLLETLRSLTGIQFKDTYHGVILAYIGFGAPLSVFLFHGFIKSIPLDIEEAAIIDGCTKPQVFFKIVLPVLKPVFVTLLVLNGMWIWNDYLLPVLVIGLGGSVKTLPLSVANLAGFYDKEWGLILTSVLMAALPVLILFLFAQKHIIKGMTSGAIK